jgi:Cu+-exporting ATPase
MAAATRTLFLSCFHSSGSETSRHLTLRSRYPSMPRRPTAAFAVEVADDGGEGGSGADLEAAAGGSSSNVAEEEKVAVFAVTGMTCTACAGSVEKAVKRLPGIQEAAVDVLGGRAQVAFYPAFVSVSTDRLV